MSDIPIPQTFMSQDRKSFSNINPRTEEFKEKNNLKKVVTGYRYLGGPLGTQEYTENYCQEKLAEWKKELESFVPIYYTTCTT